jgi:hypothetical protein
MTADIKRLFLQLGRAGAGHAQLWRGKLAAAGIQYERFVPGSRTRLLAKLARRSALNPTSACDLRRYGTAIRRRS